jgi:hypothetical protein
VGVSYTPPRSGEYICYGFPALRAGWAVFILRRKAAGESIVDFPALRAGWAFFILRREAVGESVVGFPPLRGGVFFLGRVYMASIMAPKTAKKYGKTNLPHAITL